MKIAAFQFAPVPGDAAANTAKVEAALRSAAEKNIKLVGLPEMWPTSFAFGDEGRALDATERAVERICTLSKELSLVIVGSALARSGGAKPYNSAHVVDGGSVIYQYAKTHLFLPTREDAIFSFGEHKPEVVATSAGRIGVVICYDVRFPEICRGALLNSAEIVVVPAQWAVERVLQFRALIAGRAVENQCTYLGVNRTGSEIGPFGNLIQFPGRSILANALGEIAAEGDANEGLVAAETDLDREAALRRMIPCSKTRRPELY